MYKQRVMPLLLAGALCINASALRAGENSQTVLELSAAGCLFSLMLLFFQQFVYNARSSADLTKTLDREHGALADKHMLTVEQMVSAGQLSKYSDEEIKAAGWGNNVRITAAKIRIPTDLTDVVGRIKQGK